ncbi:unnamed protein product [Blepharisma stoltei]|uniref:Uncharacterized protein n=1 Tax=Blepharisma stoltei TaxID=1481888 RepID=A0AAU9JYV3_9CILI|nr:unnamed protein product [Blepharisma stoltei]
MAGFNISNEIDLAAKEVRRSIDTENRKYSSRKHKCRIFLYVLLGIMVFSYVKFMQILGIIIVLNKDSSDCKNPIRAWLIISAIILTIGLSGVIIIEIVKEKRIIEIKIIYQGFYWIILFLLFIWMAIGSAWLFNDSACKNGRGYIDFYSGWALTLSLLVIEYFMFFLFSCYSICTLI